MKTTVQCMGYEVTITDSMILWRDNFIPISHVVFGERDTTNYNLHLSNSSIKFMFSSKVRAASFGKIVMFAITDYQKRLSKKIKNEN